jgi:hypothetical protein
MSYIFTQEELEKLCKEWQERLGLHDWTFIIEITRSLHMNESKHGAEIEFFPTQKIGKILILDPVDYIDCFKPQDQEIDLVHELNHVLFDPFIDYDRKRNDAIYYTILEQTIQKYAEALVNLKRQNVKEAK